MSGIRFWNDMQNIQPSNENIIMVGVDGEDTPSYITVGDLATLIGSQDLNIQGTAGNFAVLDGNGKLLDGQVSSSTFEYTSNKVTTLDNPNDTTFPTTKAVKDSIPTIPTVSGTAGNIAVLDGNGFVKDSGKQTLTFSGLDGNLASFSNDEIVDSGLAINSVETIKNKVISTNQNVLSSINTDDEYASAKVTYNSIQNILQYIPTGGLKVPLQIDKESNLPTATTLTLGTYYIVQDMDVTKPNAQGHVWINYTNPSDTTSALIWYKIVDSEGTPDNETITYNSANELQVNLDSNGYITNYGSGLAIDTEGLVQDIASGGKGVTYNHQELQLDLSYIPDNITTEIDSATTKVAVKTSGIVDGSTLISNSNNTISINPLYISKPSITSINIINTTTGAVTVTFDKAPNSVQFRKIVGGTVIAGSWSGSGTSSTFTPTTVTDISNGGWTIIVN